MAQLHHDYEKFKALNTEVLVVVPNGPKTIARYRNTHAIPYPILSDKGAQVTRQYAIDAKNAILMTAFTPTVFLVDQSGKIRYTNYTAFYTAEPDNHVPLALLAEMRA